MVETPCLYGCGRRRLSEKKAKSQQSGHDLAIEPNRPYRDLGFAPDLVPGLLPGFAPFFEFAAVLAFALALAPAAPAGLTAALAAAFATSRASGRAFGRELRGPRFDPGVSTLCSAL
jgi:hypothetical protein